MAAGTGFPDTRCSGCHSPRDTFSRSGASKRLHSGPAYTSVWHRDPKGRWTFHQNVPPEQSCPRYFGAAIAENTMEPIRIDWTDQRHFCVTVDAPGEIVWDIRLAPTPVTRMMNAAASAMPASWWRKRSVICAMETAARWMLGAGEMKLTGHTPNGHVFTAMPRRIWSIAESRATIRGVDAGEPAPLPKQAMLARPLYTAARNLRRRDSSAGRLVERWDRRPGPSHQSIT